MSPAARRRSDDGMSRSTRPWLAPVLLIALSLSGCEETVENALLIEVRSKRFVLYLRAKIDLAKATESSFKLPEDLFEEATALRTRLFKILGYYFDEHPVIRPQPLSGHVKSP